MTSWEETTYEKALWSKFKAQEKRDLQHTWNQIKDFLIPHVLEEIKATEPNLTDHGPRHIANVLENAYHLLHDQTGQVSQNRSQMKFFDCLTNYNAYVLGVAIMFHDVGNIFERNKHNQRIEEIFTTAFTTYQLDEELRSLVASVAGAHTAGSNANGNSIDSIYKVDQRQMWKNHAIAAQQLAAILRLSDELAEGIQRASILRLRHDLPFSDNSRISEDSEIYHHYARCVRINIDRSGQRILADLYIDLKQIDKLERTKLLTAILDTYWRRIHVLNQERKYASYYCSFLEPFKRVSAGIRFYIGGAPVDLTIPPLILDDLIVPQKSTEVPTFKGREDLRSTTIVKNILSHTGDCS